ncbi:hypothetical protein [Mycolicibacterium sp.]|jgi:hypothetical protein|uniref:hypothetical protein n=1 Tax=Mycolicibacterium sp. TaxID=2320850 RepID=UPI0028A830EC|nr:hypothetical protein [Mycolicibacterium sp.]
MHVKVTRTAASALLAGALGLGALGLGSGIGQAEPNIPGPPVPPVPGIPMPGIPDDLMQWDGPNVNLNWVPGMPPGQNPFGPPGQVMKLPTLRLPDGTVLNPNPFLNLPPGQWGMVNPLNVTWIPPGGDMVTPLNLFWNADESAWGVTVNGAFVPYPIQFPAPA